MENQIDEPPERRSANPLAPDSQSPTPDRRVAALIKEGPDHCLARTRVMKLDQFDSGDREQKHPEQNQAVAPALNIRLPVSAVAVANGDVADFQMEMVRAENEIEIAER